MHAVKQKKQNNKANNLLSELPPIPDKLYFTIGEVSRLCELKTHVLRYWEKEFVQLSPAKRRGNRRYYQRKDILLVRQIRGLLYQQGYTIEGARSQLLETDEPATEKNMPQSSTQEFIHHLETILKDLGA